VQSKGSRRNLVSFVARTHLVHRYNRSSIRGFCLLFMIFSGASVARSNEGGVTDIPPGVTETTPTTATTNGPFISLVRRLYTIPRELSRKTVPSWIKTSPKLAEDAERKLIEHHSGVNGWETRNGSIPSIVVGEGDRHVVLCHGFGTGRAIWYRQLSSLVDANFRVHALDWLAVGQNASFPSTEETESYFVQKLEAWRQENKVERFTLVGHSLGGYMSTVYALKYPERVEKLVLVSPAGVPIKPEEEVTASGRTTSRSIAYKLFSTAWNMNVTPQGLLRIAGPYGSSLLRKYTEVRYGHLDQDEKETVHQYLYHTLVAPNSHKYLSSILAPGAWAKKPLADRLPNLTMPVSFIYGSHDWMDWRAAEVCRRHMQVSTTLIKVPNSGHNIFVDAPEQFNDILVRLCNHGW